MRRALLAAVALLLLAPAAAGAHSIIRQSGGETSYISGDATSQNSLTIEPRGGDLRIHDPTVDGGMDFGPCRPGEVEPRNSWVVETFCPRGGAARLRIDLAEREDVATIAAPVPTNLLGGGGADRLATGDAPDTVLGNEGNDTVRTGGGDDSVAGGDGDDDLSGEAGADVLDGGLGADVVSAGPGDDDVRVRDGIADRVSCGEGDDRVDADTVDDLAGDCERVTRTFTAVPPGGGSPGNDRRAPRVAAGASTVQRVGRRGVIRVAATSSERGFLSASGFLDVSGLSLPLEAPRRAVAVAGAGVDLTVRLSRSQLRRVRRALARRRRVLVRLGVVGTDEAGNSAQTRAPTIRLRR